MRSPEELAALFESHNLTRLEYEEGGVRLVLERQPVNIQYLGYPAAASHLTAGATSGQLLGDASTLFSDAGAGVDGRVSAFGAGGVGGADGAGGGGTLVSNHAAGNQAAGSPSGSPVGSAANNTTFSAINPSDILVTAPLLGIIYRSAEPGSEPYATVGEHVNAGDVLCLIEAMKTFNQVTAPVGGTITAAPAENGRLAEYGDLLFAIAADSAVR
ncbi:MAG: hypothetical protein LBR39_01460 [Coriobacteriales bacterium]|jgi:acetyl-CoA carboxylase biotin carboxyl carrier protein|nr:hypothetical protein [Coriobacteriales bacterium]